VSRILPTLVKRPIASLINISSMGGFTPVPGQAIYGASKAAVKLLTEALYAELKETSVQVTIVFPGALGTNITKNSGVDMKLSKEDAEKMASSQKNIISRKSCRLNHYQSRSTRSLPLACGSGCFHVRQN
jgi:short-subunit dehydrogenase